MIINIEIEDIINFEIKGNQNRYVVKRNNFEDLYYLSNLNCAETNSAMFYKLKIIDIDKLVFNTYGYNSRRGSFPYARTKKDLIKMINKLQELANELK